MHIHIGPCGNDTLGAVVYPLTSFANGASVTMVDVSLASLTTGGFAINSHKKGAPAVYTTCGNIPLIVALDEQNDSGQSGTAALTTRGGQTEVVLVITPGTLESELVHIHIGPCGNDTLGAVVYPLTSFANGASVTMVDVSLASLTTGGFAINSHKKGAPAVYTTCGNIPGGDAMMMSGGATVMSDIQNFRLENLSIKVGTTVVWTQQDSTTHTATSGTPPNGDGTWDTGFLMEGESGDGIVFDKVGTFAYFCRVHNSMTGTVTVTE